MFTKVKSKLLEYVDYPEDQLTEQTAILADLKMNSFDIVSLMGEIEDEFGITFAKEDVHTIVTVGDLVACVQKYVATN